MPQQEVLWMVETIALSTYSCTPSNFVWFVNQPKGFVTKESYHTTIITVICVYTAAELMKGMQEVCQKRKHNITKEAWRMLILQLLQQP